MEKHQLAFLIGPIVAALALGGVLYEVYPNSFGSYSSTSGATGSTYTASVDNQPYVAAIPTTQPSVHTNNNTNQNATSVAQTNMSTVTPSPEPRQPSDNNGY